MQQPTFSSSAGFDKFSKKTRKEKFLEQMNIIVPWSRLAQLIEPFYPKPEGPGRHLIGIERMLRIHFLQHWYNLSDPAAKEALYDIVVFREFAGVDLGRESVPDETTICKFRHLLERYNIGEQLFQLINDYLAEQGLKVSYLIRVSLSL